MEDFAKKLIKNANELMENLPSVLLNVQNGLVAKYGDEDKVKEYLKAIYKQDSVTADQILKELENGK